MASYITENRAQLSDRRYIRQATTESYWFDFSFGKIEDLEAEFAGRKVRDRG